MTKYMYIIQKPNIKMNINAKNNTDAINNVLDYMNCHYYDDDATHEIYLYNSDKQEFLYTIYYNRGQYTIL